MIKAIETTYGGYKFRSRLEARWAVFFDALGIRYEYEKEGYDLGDACWYLPDFWLPEQEIWVEIKAVVPTDEERRKAMELSHGRQELVYIQYGIPGIEKEYFYTVPADGMGLEIYAGYATDTFPMRCWLDYAYGEHEFLDLANMLQEHPHLRPGPEIPTWNTPQAKEFIVEWDKAYFLAKHGYEHPRWKWGRSNYWEAHGQQIHPLRKSNSLLWSCKESDLHMDSCPTWTLVMANAYQAARSARFEYGE